MRFYSFFVPLYKPFFNHSLLGCLWIILSISLPGGLDSWFLSTVEAGSFICKSGCRRDCTKCCRTCRKIQDLLKVTVHSIHWHRWALSWHFSFILRKRINTKIVKGKKGLTVSLAHPTCILIQNLKVNVKISPHVEPSFSLARICIVLFKYTHSTLIWQHAITVPNFTLK